MNPKNEIQRKVVELSSQLPSITKQQKEWAFNNCLTRYAARFKNTLYCLECGHSWKDKAVLVSSLVGCKCPHCNADLKLNTTYQRVLIDSKYFTILDIMGGMQVVRMFFVSKVSKKWHKAITSINEVMQHWIDEKGKITTLSKRVRGMTMCYDAWISDSFLEIRTETYNAKLRAELAPYKIYPQKRILPVIKRNGYKSGFYGFAPQLLFSLILRNPNAETLLKSNQISLLRYCNNNALNGIWSSIKICIRNNYVVKDASIWIDYLRLLEHFNKDLHNASFVCPANLSKAHDHLVKKKREQDRKKKLEDMQKEIAESQKKYEEQKSKFFNLEFTDKDLVITPLKSVEEFMDEGDQLHHCVFTNKYFEKVDSIILSARIDRQPVETIEVSLTNLKIKQARGLQNKKSKYHKRIINLVENNLKQIASL